MIGVAMIMPSSMAAAILLSSTLVILTRSNREKPASLS
jgi:hypothetical protein